MVKLRLRRMGAKHRPSYRIVVTESSAPRDGRFIENLGYYDPLTDPSTVRVDKDRARHWISVGAQPSDTVRSLLVREGVLSKAGKLKKVVEQPVSDDAGTAAPAATA